MTPRLVLVTGSPRSGTTPVGDLLALAPGARSLYEPMNAVVGDRRVRSYFAVEGKEGFALDALVADVARPRLDLRPGIFPEDPPWRRVVKRVTGSRTLATYRLCRVDPTLRTIVWKDPFAALVADEVADRGVPVVVTVRPPHAVAASFARLGWRFDVTSLLARSGAEVPQLETVDIELPAVNAAVVWHVVYSRLLALTERRPDVQLVDVDGLVADPVATGRRLYDAVGLAWTPRVERVVRRRWRSDAGPSRPTTDRAHGGRRDLAAVNRYWVGVLGADEVDAVERIAGELWQRLSAAGS